MAQSQSSSPDTDQSRRIQVGEITSAHGVRGLVKIRCFAEDETLLNGPLFTGEDGEASLTVALKTIMKNCWLAEVEGISDRDAAQALAGTGLFIDRSRLPEPLPDEYYHVDLIGSAVVDPDGKLVGKVISVNNFGAGDLLDIKPPKGDTFYLPFSRETIKDIVYGTIVAEIPEGLVE